MKKAIVATLVLAMAFTMAGCGSKKKGAESTASSVAAAAESEAAAAVSEAQETAASTASTAQAAVADAASEIEAAATDAVSTAQAAVADTASTVEAVAADAASTVEAVVADTTSAIEDIAADTASVVEEVPDEIISGADGALAAIGAAAADAAETAADDLMSTADSIASAVNEEDMEGAASIDEEAESGAEGLLNVMSYEEYVAAPVDTPVMVETYVQAKQAWFEKDGQGKATIYTQDEDGAYFIYEMACSEEDYNALTEGQKIIVSGYKGEWAGEVEIVDATFEIADGNLVAEAEDVTALLGKDELGEYMNRKVAFKGLTVEAAETADSGVESVAETVDAPAFTYGWDGSGQEGDDLYFKASYEGQTYTFVVESYLCDSSSDVYKAVKELKAGDKIDLEGFLYWYEGAQPHITSVTAAA